MKAQHETERSAHPFASVWTNILAGIWGAAAAYILFDSLFITHKNRYAIAAIFPLVAAWATLERKRWGRLALIGLSVTTVAVFALLTGLFAVSRHPWQREALTLTSGAASLLLAYGLGTAAAIGLLSLAALTGCWLCLPNVAKAFNQNKRATLMKAQHAIAMVVVGCWGAAIALGPLMGDQENTNKLPSRAAPRDYLPRSAASKASQSARYAATYNDSSDNNSSDNDSSDNDGYYASNDSNRATRSEASPRRR